VTKVAVLSAFVFLSFTVSAFADISDYAPDKRPAGRDEVKDLCIAMGAAGMGFGLDGTGSYGCQNTVNGNALICGADGQCTDHVGDPRWRRIKTLIDGAGKKEGLRPQIRVPVVYSASSSGFNASNRSPGPGLSLGLSPPK